MSSYTQITCEERYQIYTLLKIGKNQSEIAELLERDKSSISREIRRNTGKRGYRPKQAHQLAEGRRKAVPKYKAMTDEMIESIESEIRHEWSPEQVSGRAKLDGRPTVSHETIYQHIWKDKQQGGDLYKSLRCQGKKYQKRRNGKSTRGAIKNAVSIDKRPKAVDEMKRVGDWEIDTVIGKNHKGAIVTIVEKKTRFLTAALVSSKHAEPVTSATLTLLASFKGRLHTITADNGKEFAYHEEITEKLGAKVYFAHPYSSWERGVNENTNGLLRQYFPKGTDFRTLTQAEIDFAVARINNRPRKVLGFKTATEMMDKSLSRLAA